jgi:hypothetical protein
VRRTILADQQQTIRKATAALAMEPVKTFTDRLSDGPGQGLPRELRQFFHKPISFVVLDVEAHRLYLSTINVRQSTSPRNIGEGDVAQARRPGRFALLSFLMLPLSQAHPGTSTVLVDEFDAGGFQSSSELASCLI